MGKVQYAAGIDFVSGAMCKPSKKGGHKCGSYLIGTHRVAATTNPDCMRIYIKPKDAYERSTPVTQAETVIRTRFSSVAAAVATRAKDLSKIAADQAAFEAQRNTPGGKTTMKSYLWSLELAAYDQAHPRG